MFDKLLIANRGEIACRVIRTAKRMGIATVAVYSDADRDALHVRLADERIAIGAAAAADSYLNTERIVEACRATGATAVHPGYGFLAESAAFCERLEAEGITFVGPPAAAMRAMGDKIAAKSLAAEAGVRVIPGTGATPEDEDAAVEAAGQIGYPVMVKAAAGGGGKGMRVAWDDRELLEAVESCRSEARGAFGDDRVFVEKYVVHPRHIEFQVLADGHGNVVHLWDRECSIQRRHQKVVEEAPSPFLDDETRRAMGEQAVALAERTGYRSAGTVEFVVDPDAAFYFLEMNTRIQVEHPVTEMICGLDLVEWMLRIAAGEHLPFTQADVRAKGWAIECRVNAEDPLRNFLPSFGRLVRYSPPAEVDGRVRVDSGVEEGDRVPPYYDSLIAKLVTHADTRDEAIASMRTALDRFVVHGVATTVAFQAALLRHPRFIEGDFHTGFMAEEYPGGFNAADTPAPDEDLVIAVAAYVHRARIDRQASVSGQLPGHELRVAEDWTVVVNGERHPVTVRPVRGGYSVTHRARSLEIASAWQLGQPLLCGTCNGTPFCMQVEHVGQMFRLTRGGTQSDVRVMTARTTELLLSMPEKPSRDLSGILLSPMPGLLTRLLVEEGQQVHAGEALAVVEAMKMENALRADHDCVVAGILVLPGEAVTVGQPILELR